MATIKISGSLSKAVVSRLGKTTIGHVNFYIDDAKADDTQATLVIHDGPSEPVMTASEVREMLKELEATCSQDDLFDHIVSKHITF